MSEAGKGYFHNCVISSLLIVLCVGPIAFGADTVPLAGDQRVLTTAQQQLRETVTFTCRELPIDTVLMQLAEQAKVDIIKSPKVKGNVTVKITDVPLDEALNNILAAHSWTYVASENMIRVMPLAEVDIAKDKLATSIYQITYANVEDVAKALRNYLSAKGKIAFNKGTNHIIVTDTEQKTKAVDRFIAQIDRETPQVMVEARIYDITTTEDFEIGFDWIIGRNTPITEVENKKTFSRTNTANPPYSETTDVTDTTGIIGTTEIIQQFYYLIDDYGRPKPAVYRDVEGNLTDADGNPSADAVPITVDDPLTPWDDRLELDPEESEYGEKSESTTDTTSNTETTGEWIPPSGWGETTTTTTSETDSPIYKSKPFVGGAFTQDSGGTLRFGLMNDMISLDVVLSLLSKQVEAKLLANPRVLVLDNETANIKIVKEIPYTESLQTLGAGGLTIARVQFKEVGVQLLVTPHIAREGMIRLKLKPEFGVEATVQNPGSKAASAPAVDTRTLDTVALVKDGQTVVMGGLRKKKKTKGISKVPLLGDMPLLGDLFRYETENEETNELVVFITPTIVSTNVLTEAEERQLEATRFPSPGLSKAGKKKQTGVGSEETDVVAVESEEVANKG